MINDGDTSLNTLLVEPAPLAKCEHVTQVTFPLKTFLYNLIEFPMQKLLKIQYLRHLRSEHFQITFISPTLQGVSNNIKSVPDFPIIFSSDLNEFSVKELFNIH